LAATQARRPAGLGDGDEDVDRIALAGTDRDASRYTNQSRAWMAEQLLDVLDALLAEVLLQHGALRTGRGTAAGILQAGDQADAGHWHGFHVGDTGGEFADRLDLGGVAIAVALFGGLQARLRMRAAGQDE